MSRVSTKTAQPATIHRPDASISPAATWRERVEAADWNAVRADLDRYGCGLISQRLSPKDAAEIAVLYPEDLPSLAGAMADGGTWAISHGRLQTAPPPLETAR